MANIADITVYDGAATPVSHVLKAVSVTRNNNEVVAEWRESVATVPTYAQVRASMKISRLKSGVYRVEQRTVVPVMESIAGSNASGYTAAPKVAYEDTVILTGLFHERSVAAGRRLVRQLALNLGGNVSTSVAAATAGPLPELFDLLVAPT